MIQLKEATQHEQGQSFDSFGPQGSSSSSFVDNRPEAVIQRRRAETINSSPHVMQLLAYQGAANGSLQVQQLKAAQASANGHATAPVQATCGTCEAKASEGEIQTGQEGPIQAKCAECAAKEETAKKEGIVKEEDLAQLKCEKCQKEDEEKGLQLKPIQRRLTPVYQLNPGNGMTPPGDCSWAQYGGLRASVEAAKSIVSSLGSCAIGDSCSLLATKIAAIATEIGARVALDTTCFRGGDNGHREQVQAKINMMNRCYRYFSNSNCPQQLVTAMETVVARAMDVLRGIGTAVLIVAAVAALIAAIIVLVKAIVALAAGAVTAAAVAAVMALLVTIQGLISPDSGAPASA